MMTLKMESGDYMDNLMTLIMSIVRKMTSSDQKMSADDAITALKSSDQIEVNIKNHTRIDLNDVTQSGILWLAGAKGDAAADVETQHVPLKNCWWYVLTLYANSSNILQIAIPDHNINLYIRTHNVNGWLPWTKLGGGN